LILHREYEDRKSEPSTHVLSIIDPTAKVKHQSERKHRKKNIIKAPEEEQRRARSVWVTALAGVKKFYDEIDGSF
jgi:hypothetical protein